MFQPTTLLTLLALTTSAFSTPNNLLEKRYQCVPSVPREDCVAKSNYFNACADKKILSVATCYAQSLNVTAANPNYVPPPGTPTTTLLEKRYQCEATVPIADCSAKSAYFSRCEAAKLIPAAECYKQSLNVTATPVDSGKAPKPTTPTKLEDKKYQCVPNITVEECERREFRYNNCIANGVDETQCYLLSQLPTESKK